MLPIKIKEIVKLRYFSNKFATGDKLTDFLCNSCLCMEIEKPIVLIIINKYSTKYPNVL